MRNFALYLEKTGEIIAYIKTSSPQQIVMSEGEEYLEYFGEKPVNCLVIDKVFVEKQDKPFESSIYNPDTKCYELDKVKLSRIKDKKLQEINLKRDELINSPIELGGKVYDAGRVNIQNLSSKLQELTLLESIPDDYMFWRTSENETIYYASLEEYKNFLNTLFLGLTTRTSLLYKQSWELKNKLIYALDPLVIETFDVQTEWDIL